MLTCLAKDLVCDRLYINSGEWITTPMPTTTRVSSPTPNTKTATVDSITTPGRSSLFSLETTNKPTLSTTVTYEDSTTAQAKTTKATAAISTTTKQPSETSSVQITKTITIKTPPPVPTSTTRTTPEESGGSGSGSGAGTTDTTILTITKTKVNNRYDDLDDH